MRARDIMTCPVYTVRPDTTIEQAAALLSEHGFAGAPVVDEERVLVGIISEADLIRHRVPSDPTAHLWRVAAGDHVARPHLVSEVMTHTVITAYPDTDVADIAHQMLEHSVRSVPVLDQGEVVGIVGRRDILRTVVRTDDVVAGEVQRRLDQYAMGHRRWTAAVEDGVVQVSGNFDDEVERQVIGALARTVPGVSEVRVLVLA
jgi:CBS domain-containing protein